MAAREAGRGGAAHHDDRRVAIDDFGAQYEVDSVEFQQEGGGAEPAASPLRDHQDRPGPVVLGIILGSARCPSSSA